MLDIILSLSTVPLYLFASSQYGIRVEGDATPRSTRLRPLRGLVSTLHSQTFDHPFCCTILCVSVSVSSVRVCFVILLPVPLSHHRSVNFCLRVRTKFLRYCSSPRTSCSRPRGSAFALGLSHSYHRLSSTLENLRCNWKNDVLTAERK